MYKDGNKQIFIAFKPSYSIFLNIKKYFYLVKSARNEKYASIPNRFCLGAVLTETCVFETRFMRHYNVCSKMMEKGRKMWDVTCFFPSPSFYYIHCSDAWNAFQTHTFRSRRPLNSTMRPAQVLRFLKVAFRSPCTFFNQEDAIKTTEGKMLKKNFFFQLELDHQWSWWPILNANFQIFF